MNLKPNIICTTFEARLNRIRVDKNYNYEEDRDYTDEEKAEIQGDEDYMTMKDEPYGKGQRLREKYERLMGE